MENVVVVQLLQCLTDLMHDACDCLDSKSSAYFQSLIVEVTLNNKFGTPSMYSVMRNMASFA